MSLYIFIDIGLRSYIFIFERRYKYEGLKLNVDINSINKLIYTYLKQMSI